MISGESERLHSILLLSVPPHPLLSHPTPPSPPPDAPSPPTRVLNPLPPAHLTLIRPSVRSLVLGCCPNPPRHFLVCPFSPPRAAPPPPCWPCSPRHCHQRRRARLSSTRLAKTWHFYNLLATLFSSFGSIADVSPARCAKSPLIPRGPPTNVQNAHSHSGAARSTHFDDLPDRPRRHINRNMGNFSFSSKLSWHADTVYFLRLPTTVSFSTSGQTEPLCDPPQLGS